MDFLKKEVGGFSVGIWMVIAVSGIGLGLLFKRGFGGGGGGGEGYDPEITGGPGGLVIRSELPNEGALIEAVTADLQPSFEALDSQIRAQQALIDALSASNATGGSKSQPSQPNPPGTNPDPDAVPFVSTGLPVALRPGLSPD